jgi:hypothetical protein
MYDVTSKREIIQAYSKQMKETKTKGNVWPS